MSCKEDCWKEKEAHEWKDAYGMEKERHIIIGMDGVLEELKSKEMNFEEELIRKGIYKDNGRDIVRFLLRDIIKDTRR